MTSAKPRLRTPAANRARATRKPGTPLSPRPAKAAAPAPPVWDSMSADEQDTFAIVCKQPGISSAALRRLLVRPVSQPTLSRRLEKMALLLRREGGARTTRYFVRDALVYLDRPLGSGHEIGYNLDWLQQFRPNRDHFFSELVRQQLHAAGRVPGMQPSLFYQRVFERFLIDMSWASSHMEGNTYSLLDTGRLIREGIEARGKTAVEATMILNHKNALLYMIEHVDALQISEREIKNIHTLLARGLLPPGEPGRLRSALVGIGKSNYVPLSVPSQIAEQFKLLTLKAAAITDPLEQSIFLLVALPYLQPFMDVNKRTGRIVANLPLFKAGLCPLSFGQVEARRYTGGLLLFYETQNHQAIADAYSSGYLASAQTLREQAGQLRNEPDRVDLIYRRGIDLAVKEIVLRAGMGAKAAPERVIERITRVLPAADREAVKARTLELLAHLSADNAIGFGLFPDQVEQYRLRRKAPGKTRPAAR